MNVRSPGWEDFDAVPALVPTADDSEPTRLSEEELRAA